MLVGFGDGTIYTTIFPDVNAFGDVGFVWGIFVIVNQLLKTVLLKDVGVEEGDVLDSDCVIFDSDEGLVSLVDPVLRKILAD